MPRRPKPEPTQLHSLLEERYHRYNRPSFIEEDPISIPHRFAKREDIEIAGLLTALLAWGRRDIILRSAADLMRRMDDSPAEFVQTASPRDLRQLDSFVHRTFNGIDAVAMVKGLRIVQKEGGLEEAFSKYIGGVYEGTEAYMGIISFRNTMMKLATWPARSAKHLANPAGGSSAKRLNMYLRWMVRNDRRGVDFGLWTRLRPAHLICPLDVHTGTVARQLGLLTRKQNDWQAAEELTAALRQFDPDDPVKYDFSLFGMGAYGELE